MKTIELNRLEGRRVKRSDDRYEIETEPSGLFESIKRILITGLAVLQTRIELITLELKELKGRALGLIFWGAALVFLAFMTLVALMGTIVFLLWDNALQVLMGFSGLFILGSIVSLFAAKAKLSKIPFGETVDQLKKDRELVTRRE